MIELPTIQQLKCLLCYGKENNFTRGAQQANITQSAFSAQIKKLEETVGLKLIQRTNKGSHLTPPGEKMLAIAEKHLTDLQQEILTLRQEQQQEPTLLKIGVMRTLGDVLMNRHVQHFQQEKKPLDLVVYDMESSEILTDLRDDKIDLASVYMIHPKPFAEYEQIHLAWDQMVYYAPFLNISDKQISRSAIINHPMVYYPNNYFMEQTVGEYFAYGKPPRAATLSTPYAMVHFCQQNPAGAILPQRLIEALGIKQGVYSLQEPLLMDNCIVFKKDTPKRADIEFFINYLRPYFAD